MKKREEVREFDAHIYFSAEQETHAQNLRSLLLLHFGEEELWVSPLGLKLAGPHPLRMFEVNFPKKYYASLRAWLLERRGPLRVLLHPVTDDDFADHDPSVCDWLGEPLPLDFGAFVIPTAKTSASPHSRSSG